MGSKFVEKHKRKSVLALLLLLFQGRTKYVGILLILTILSVPFVISGDMLGRIIELRPVAAFLRTVGLGSIVSSINPKYSNDLLRAALDRAASDSEQNSFWQKFLKSVNATLPPGGGPSSLAMIRGGADDIFGPPELKDGKYGKTKPGDVKGAVNDEEKARGEGADGVDLQGLLAGAGAGYGEGPGDGSGLYGDLMGRNMSGAFGSGSAAGSGPYANRTLLSGPGGSVGRGGANMYSNVMKQSASKVPVPNSPAKVNTKTMGRVSGFSWKNVGYQTKSARMDTKLGTKKPMFQLAETFGMTGTAYREKDSAYEYQAAYVGSTYDGNDVNLDVVHADGAGTAPMVPDTSFTSGLITGANDLQQMAENCSKSQGTHGAKMSENGKKMDDTARTLGKPPKCCSGGVGAWNGKINSIIGYCNDFNVNEAQLAAACQNKSSPMDCTSYNKMKIKPCSKLKCWLAVFLMIFLGFLFFGLIGALIVGVLAAGSMMGGSMFGPIGDMIGGFISKVAGGE